MKTARAAILGGAGAAAVGVGAYNCLSNLTLPQRSDGSTPTSEKAPGADLAESATTNPLPSMEVNRRAGQQFGLDSYHSTLEPHPPFGVKEVKTSSYGDPEVGVISIIGHVHGSRLCVGPGRLQAAQSTLSVIGELRAFAPDAIFVEGFTVGDMPTLSASEVSAIRSVLMPRSWHTSQEERQVPLPDPTQLDQFQIDIITMYSAAELYLALEADPTQVKLYPSECSEIRDQIDKLTEELHVAQAAYFSHNSSCDAPHEALAERLNTINQEFETLVNDLREAYAMQAVNDYLHHHPGAKVALPFGTSHLWGLEDFCPSVVEAERLPVVQFTHFKSLDEKFINFQDAFSDFDWRGRPPTVSWMAELTARREVQRGLIADSVAIEAFVWSTIVCSELQLKALPKLYYTSPELQELKGAGFQQTMSLEAHRAAKESLREQLLTGSLSPAVERAVTEAAERGTGPFHPEQMRNPRHLPR